MQRHSDWTQEQLLEGVAVLRGCASESWGEQRTATIQHLRDLTPKQRESLGVGSQEFSFWDERCDHLLTSRTELHTG